MANQQLIFTNNAATTIAGAITNVATSVNLSPGSGALFPNPGTGQAFLGTFIDAATGLIREIVLVTARATDTLTIVRGQEGSAAAAWNSGDLFQLLVTAGTLASFLQGNTPPHGECQLQFVSATSIKLVPLNGQSIVIGGVTFAIPAAGISAANTATFVNGTGASNLAASTGYYVVLFNNAGVATIGFRTMATFGHMPDTTPGNIGVEVTNNAGSPITGETIIGAVFTNASSQFSDADGQRNVLSWFNRRRRSSKTSFTVTRTSTSTTFAEINTEIRNTFISWATEFVDFIVEGEHQIGSTIGNLVNTGVGFDSTTVNEPEMSSYQGYAASATGGNASVRGCKNGLSETAQHFATLLARVTGTTPTATYLAASAAGHIPVQLTIVING